MSHQTFFFAVFCNTWTDFFKGRFIHTDLQDLNQEKNKVQGVAMFQIKSQ